MEQPYVVIDCHAICHAAKHSLHGLSVDDRATGVIYGFVKRVLSFSKTFNSTKFLFAWDSNTYFRREIFPGYKCRDIVNKSEEDIRLDDAAYPQFAALRDEILPSIGFRNNFLWPDHEADDIIASLVACQIGPEYIVVSSDNDLYQLLDYCRMWNPSTKKFYTKQDFIKEYGIEPHYWKRVKTLVGCPGDKVPGIPGIGPKRAIQLIKGQLKGKYRDEIMAGKWNELIKRNEELVGLPSRIRHFDIREDEITIQKIVRTLEPLSMESLLKDSSMETWRNFCG